MNFKTLINFRDLGNYKTKDGRQITAKRLLRSGEIHNISADERKQLADTYHLKTIIDLRSEKEVKEKPDDQIPHTKYHHIDMFKGDEHEAPALAYMKKERHNLSGEQRMLLIYEHLILSSVSQKGFRAFLDLVLHNKNGSIIWHCFAGKDRTGLSAAFILYLLGASKETIYYDYMLSNPQREKANAAIIAKFRAEGRSEKRLDTALTMLEVKKKYLDYSIQLMKEEYKSVDHYIHDIIGVRQEEKKQLRDMYLI